VFAALLTIGEEFHRIPTSQSDITRVELKENTLKDKARKDSRGRSALAKSANLGHGTSSSPSSSSSLSSLAVSKYKRGPDEIEDLSIPTKKAQLNRGKHLKPQKVACGRGMYVPGLWEVERLQQEQM